MPSDQVHWDNAYSGADITQLGWYQDIHEVSLDLISKCDGKKIIDVGAGATTLIENLIELDYEVSALDISKIALDKLKQIYGDKIDYIHGNLTKNLNLKEYDIWHDRAALHFLLEKEERDSYILNLNSASSCFASLTESTTLVSLKTSPSLRIFKSRR